jgi:hypothetical protein
MCRNQTNTRPGGAESISSHENQANSCRSCKRRKEQRVCSVAGEQRKVNEGMSQCNERKEWKSVLNHHKHCQISRSCNSWRESNRTTCCNHSNRREVLEKKVQQPPQPTGKCNELVQQQPPQQNEENHAMKGTPGSCQKELLQPPQPTLRSTRNQPSKGMEEKGKASQGKGKQTEGAKGKESLRNQLTKGIEWKGGKGVETWRSTVLPKSTYSACHPQYFALLDARGRWSLLAGSRGTVLPLRPPAN